MIYIIMGPTCSGKTELANYLIDKLNCDAINFDAFQIYKDMNIGTAKVTEEEKEGIPHHLLDIRSVDQDYTVYDYQKDCRICIDDILSRGKVPILVGGTGLYIKAALYDYEFKDENIMSGLLSRSNSLSLCFGLKTP